MTYKESREENEGIDYLLRGKSVYQRFPVSRLEKGPTQNDTLLGWKQWRF